MHAGICVLCVYAAVITELARSTKALAELGGRTHPLVADIVVALVEMGMSCLQFVLLTFSVHVGSFTFLFATV